MRGLSTLLFFETRRVGCSAARRRARILLAIFLACTLLRTASPARGQTAVLSVDFDAVTAPAPPLGWTLGMGWETSTGSPSNGSGGNNLTHSGSQATVAVLPGVDLSGATFATLSFLARRTGSYDPSNLRLAASLDNGATFPVTVLTSAVPAATSVYETISVALPSVLLGEPNVVLRFEGLGISSSSANARLDDLVIEAYDAGDGAGGTLGFSTVSGAAIAGDTIEVEVRLDFSAPPGLQGLQFRVDWTLDSLRLLDAVTSLGGAWSLSTEARTHQADVILLGEGVTGLPSGTYDPLITLRLTAGNLDAEVVDVLTLSGVVGALATPEGTDAGLTPGVSLHGLTVSPGVADFAAAPVALDLGTVSVGASDSAVVTVSNLAGTTDLQVIAATTTNPLFSVLPASGIVAPGASLLFMVVFTPADTAFGLQEGALVLRHTGPDSVATIPLTGKGRGGRGDAEGDGTVDVLDLIHAIDFVLARLSPEPAQTAAADLFPFPAGDGTLDVRDLTVLSQAVARGQWPDGLALPMEVATAGKTSAGSAQVTLLQETDGYVLELRHVDAIRAFQLVLPTVADQTDVRLVGASAMAVRSGFDGARGELRIVAYVTDGGAVAPGTTRLALSRRVGPPRYATLIGTDRRRIPVEADVATWSGETPDPEPMGSPYPNPFVVGRDLLRIHGVPVDADVTVYDVLGRRVMAARVAGSEFEWDGRDASGRQLTPGLYVARLTATGVDRSWAVVALR